MADKPVRMNRVNAEELKQILLAEPQTSMFIWGPPGVGKTAVIDAVAKELERKCYKLLLSTMDSPDLRGILIPDTKSNRAVFLRPYFLPNTDERAVLFLDELNTAPPDVQPPAYQITLEKRVGDHKLPDDLIVIAAGNRADDASVAYRMSKALCNRMIHLEFEVDADIWFTWAIKNDIHENVLAFIKFAPQYLMMFNPQDPDPRFPSPRTWEMVSHIEHSVDEGRLSRSLRVKLIAGTVGDGVAIEYDNLLKVKDELPEVEAVLRGESTFVPKQMDRKALWFAMIVTRAKVEHLSALEKYLNAIKEPEFAHILVTALSRKHGWEWLKRKNVSKWLKENAKLIV